MKRVRPLLGTFVGIELQGAADEASSNAWITAGFEAIEEIDQLMSRHRADSDVARLNEAPAEQWVEVNPLTATVLQASNALFQASHGIFDIRCGTAPNESICPLRLENARVQKTGPWEFDLGGIAKGFAVDRAVEKIQALASRHEISGTVDAGGDLRLWGCGSVPAAAQIQGQGTFWLQPFVVKETAAATSSVRTRENERLAPAVHRQMPSGTPLEKQQTVTVFAHQCLWADALTKVVLMASEHVARACLASYHAKALVFNPNGALKTVMG